MKKSIEFHDFEEARQLAGIFLHRLYKELSINERTYYRWKAKGKAPCWAFKIVELLSGDLTVHGWQGWYIQKDRLFHDQLNPLYHSWGKTDLLSKLYE